MYNYVMKNNIFLQPSVIALIVLICSVLVGCSNQTDIIDSGLSYPINNDVIREDFELEPSYPIEYEDIITEESVFIIPTPISDKGLVYGQVLSLTFDDPIPFSIIYLGTKMEIGQEEEYIITIHENTSPKGISNEVGMFVIPEITPGNYILIFSTPDNNYPLLNKHNDQIHLSIDGGESIDLGEVYTTWP